MTNLADISGIAETYAQKLHAAGVPTVEALLEQGGHARRSGADRESQWYRARADPHLGQPRRSVSHPRRRRRVCGAARGERRRYGPGTRSTQPRAPDREDGAGQSAEEPRAPAPDRAAGRGLDPGRQSPPPSSDTLSTSVSLEISNASQETASA